MDFLHSWNVSTLLAMALMLVAAAMLVLGLGMARRLRGQNRSRQVVDHALARQGGGAPPQALPAQDAQGKFAAATRAADSFGKRLSEGRLAESLLAAEDRKLVDLAGYSDSATARSRFVVVRFGLAILLPVVAVALGIRYRHVDSVSGIAISAFLGFALGYMLPKWFVRRRVARRRRMAADELPLLIDLLRLLQGVGLSLSLIHI